MATYGYYAQRETPGANEKGFGAAVPAATVAASGGAKNATGAPATVDVVKVSAATLRDDVNAAGTIRSNEAVILRPEVAGRITRLNFGDGQPVKKGQVLVAFDSTVNQAEVQQAKAELEIAKANFQRNDELARQKFISIRARDESAANVQVLEAKLALAQARLSKLEIKAPFSGIVGMRTVSVGDYVKDGADLVNLEDISSVKVDFRVPEKFVDRVQRGQELEVTVDALPDRPFKARVDAIDPQVDSSGRSALLRGRIDNPQGKLKPGMFARVRLTLTERSNALMVPEEAIVPQGDKPTVWKVVDGKAMRTEVRTGLRQQAKVEILDGLKLGDMVVTAGQIRLSGDGAPVTIAPESVQDASSEAKPKQARAEGDQSAAPPAESAVRRAKS
ncbi:MAG: efflux transporter periplasmic adaptor subunit [Noviherbaspirillum sp.]|nr:efflux transporter periplasmic adaptor subunit [Noviherbaspirillum sp.]